MAEAKLEIDSEPATFSRDIQQGAFEETGVCMYCPHCGNPVASDLKFCTNCGTQMPDLSLLANAEPAPAPAPVPVPVPAPAQTPVTPSPVVTAAPATNRRGATMRIVAAVIVVVLVLVAGTATFLGMRGLLPWQSVPVPSLDQLAGKQGATVDSLTADQVEQELRSEGFQTTRSQQYSGKNAGAFLAFSNVSEGQQLRHGDLIDIIESLGPGVPSGTVGTQAADSKQTLAGMNVPVTYRAVVTSVPGSSFGPADSSPQPGTVVATYPADGQPVTDTDKGITVAVATQSDTGIPVDYYGQDPDAVQADLESRGYTVTRKAKFSTKANVGKVVASDPALGTAAVAGTSVTLYYGVDSSSTHDVFTGIYPATGVNVGTEAAWGTYCRKDGDCITLSKDCSKGYCELYSSQAPTSLSKDEASTKLEPCLGIMTSCLPSSQDDWQYFAKDNGNLVYGTTGTFELTTERQLRDATCETDWDYPYYHGVGSVTTCIDGKLETYTQDEYDAQHPNTSYSNESLVPDLEYQMDDVWYVYVPVGADITSVERAGYFDDNAMSEARSQGAPNANTPYFIARDPSLYDTREVRLSDISNQDVWLPTSPFMPFLDNSSRLAVNPAPSDQSAYYLVENPVDPNNLGAFPETDIDDLSSSDESTSEPSESAQPSPSATSSESSASPSASPSATPKTYTPDEVKAAVGSGDFTPLAGTYCAKYSSTPDSCYTIDASGKITLTGDERGTEQLKTKTISQEDTTLFLSGLDSYGGCITETGVDYSNYNCDLASTYIPYWIIYCPDPGSIDWASLGAISTPRENTPYIHTAYKGATSDYAHSDGYFDNTYYKVS